MENYDIFYMLPNLKCNFLIPLLTEQFFFTYSTYKAPPNLQLGLSSKGGCDIGEALAVEGEVQEKLCLILKRDTFLVAVRICVPKL